ncbi:MAG TPA: hypothetical protein VGV60_05260 [Candidatus Polarisedimenticolia bacterium]|jgi:hypothetical protein|nr:hypothetical protein [Candidatus Polarisedimenticolia bacterium]
MESTRARAGSLPSTVCLLLAIALAVNGCAVAVLVRDRLGVGKGVEQGELARLRDQPEVLAIHYAAPPFLVRRTALKRRTGLAGLEAGGPAALLLLPVIVPIVIRINAGVAAANEAQEAGERAEGAELTHEVGLGDPVVLLKERLASRLAGEISRIRPVVEAMHSDDLKSLKQAFGSATILDVKTTGWGLHYHMEDTKTFFALYRVRARLIRLDQDKVVWQAELTCAAGGDRQFGLPTLEELRANGGALLKTAIAQAAEVCAEPLLTRFRGEEPTRPPFSPGESADLTLERSTPRRGRGTALRPLRPGCGLPEVRREVQGRRPHGPGPPAASDAAAGGDRLAGGVRGSGPRNHGRRPIQGHDGQGQVGSRRVEFEFEGLAFAGQAQASAFLEPFLGRGVRQVKLAGVAGGRPVKLKLTPAPGSTLSSPPLSDAGPSNAGKEADQGAGGQTPSAVELPPSPAPEVAAITPPAPVARVPLPPGFPASGGPPAAPSTSPSPETWAGSSHRPEAAPGTRPGPPISKAATPSSCGAG